MDKSKWVWMPHAGHFCLSDKCQFHLNTYVGDYIVSTIGELKLTREDKDFEKIGSDRLYETKVFRAISTDIECCPYHIVGEELDFAGYNSAGEAYRGHLEMCEKWDNCKTVE